MFAGVNAKIISKAIVEKTKTEIPEEFIQIEKPIKKIGNYDVKVGNGQIKVEIVSKDKKEVKKKKEEK